MSHRREDVQRGFIKWPKCDGYPWKDSHEGGMECWLVIIGKTYKGVRGVCMTGFTPAVVTWDVVTSKDWEIHGVNLTQSDREMSLRTFHGEQRIHVDFAACIGATGQSIYSDKSSYFQANTRHLTKEGLAFYNMVRKLYEEKPRFIMALDT